MKIEPEKMDHGYTPAMARRLLAELAKPVAEVKP